MHFTAFARSKKGAEHAAAEKALDFIMSMGLLQPPAKTSVVPFLAPSAGSDISLEEVSLPWTLRGIALLGYAVSFTHCWTVPGPFMCASACCFAIVP